MKIEFRSTFLAPLSFVSLISLMAAACLPPESTEFAVEQATVAVEAPDDVLAEYEIAPDITATELIDGRVGYRASGIEAARELIEMLGLQDVELKTADELGFSADQLEMADELGLSVDDHYSERGSCPVCSPDWTMACGFGSLSWQQVCQFNSSTPIYSVGGNCGWCYGGSTCYQVPNQGNVGASPTTVQVSNVTGCTTVNWDLTCSTGSVCVSVNNGPETLFASGNSGSQQACWIQAGKTYTFSLYEGGCGSNLLDSVQVTGVQAPDPCLSCASGTSCHCFDNICRPNNTFCP